MKKHEEYACNKLLELAQYVMTVVLPLALNNNKIIIPVYPHTVCMI